jgi:hypothetical protein
MTHEFDLVDAADNSVAYPLKLVISGCPSNTEVDPEIKAMLCLAASD